MTKDKFITDLREELNQFLIDFVNENKKCMDEIRGNTYSLHVKYEKIDEIYHLLKSLTLHENLKKDSDSVQIIKENLEYLKNSFLNKSGWDNFYPYVSRFNDSQPLPPGQEHDNLVKEYFKHHLTIVAERLERLLKVKE